MAGYQKLSEAEQRKMVESCIEIAGIERIPLRMACENLGFNHSVIYYYLRKFEDLSKKYDDMPRWRSRKRKETETIHARMKRLKNNLGSIKARVRRLEWSWRTWK